MSEQPSVPVFIRLRLTAPGSSKCEWLFGLTEKTARKFTVNVADVRRWIDHLRRDGDFAANVYVRGGMLKIADKAQRLRMAEYLETVVGTPKA